MISFYLFLFFLSFFFFITLEELGKEGMSLTLTGGSSSKNTEKMYAKEELLYVTDESSLRSIALCTRH